MLSHKEVSTIRDLLHQGYSISYIGNLTGRSSTTIYKIKLNQDSKENYTGSESDRYISYIKKRQRKGVTNLSKIYQELKNLGYTGSYHKLYRYMQSVSAQKNKDSRFPKIRESTPAEEAQVDWGSFRKIIVNGKVERLYAFVYVLGYSRMKYVEFTTKQNLQTLLTCHINAFRQLQIPRSIIYDNMKTVVLYRDRKDNLKPTFNSTFLDFANHYGFKIVLSHPYWPRDKGKVEAAVKFVRNNFMNGMKFDRDFHTIPELNEKVRRWLEDTHKTLHGSTREMPLRRFKYEKKFLRKFKSVPQYNLTKHAVRYSTQYSTIQYKNNFYEVPQRFSRKKLFVKETVKNGMGHINIYFQDKCIQSHVLISGRNQWVESKSILKQQKIIKSQTTKQKYKSRKQSKIKKTVRDFTRPVSYYEQLLKSK